MNRWQHTLDTLAGPYNAKVERSERMRRIAKMTPPPPKKIEREGRLTAEHIAQIIQRYKAHIAERHEFGFTRALRGFCRNLAFEYDITVTYLKVLVKDTVPKREIRAEMRY